MIFMSPEAELPAFFCAFFGSEIEATNKAEAIQQYP
jgi:hypothetical protein